MKRVRPFLFWMHLIAGVSAGVVILIMSATGALLAFQPQILAWLERDVRVVERVEPAANRLDADHIVAAAMASRPDAAPASAVFEADPRAAVAVSFGREGTVWVNPYSGRVLGEGASTARAFFQRTTEWHRWLAMQGEGRATARAITGASNLAFLLLGLSGLYLWMPRKWSLKNVRAVAWFQRSGTPRARDFNWHNAIGLWCAPAIIVMAATAVVMSYPWANRLVYRMAGTPLPAQQSRPPAEGAGRNAERAAAPAAPANVDRAIAQAAERMPTWKSMTVRFAPGAARPLSLSLVDGSYWNAYARSTLTVDAATGAALRWDPYTAQTRGQKWRGWIRFAHTGELGGVMAQGVAGVACVGGVFLVWTGLSLALRRLAASRPFRVESSRSRRAA
jgi:uncharacterized iron-regulated membrane protein